MTSSVLIRPHARYQCHGDGTCCTSIHLLGPLGKREAKIARKAGREVFGNGATQVVSYHEGNNDLALTLRQHRCVFLDDDARCRLHEHVGEQNKPKVCRRFPVGATKTPHGVRATLSHRCPCVSIGDAPLFDAKRAEKILASSKSGRMDIDVEVNEEVRWRGDKTISFEDYVAWETPMIERLVGASSATHSTEKRGQSTSIKGVENSTELPLIQELLGMSDNEQLPTLKKRSWDSISNKMLEWVEDEAEEDGFFCTIRWAAGEMKSQRYPWRAPLRPWSWSLDRTARRVTKPYDIRMMYGTWVADYLWSMAWSVELCVHRALADISARYALANRLMNRLHDTGSRKDLAAAEAIMIVDTVAASEPWEWVTNSLKI